MLWQIPLFNILKNEIYIHHEKKLGANVKTKKTLCRHYYEMQLMEIIVVRFENDMKCTV